MSQSSSSRGAFGSSSHPPGACNVASTQNARATYGCCGCCCCCCCCSAAVSSLSFISPGHRVRTSQKRKWGKIRSIGLNRLISSPPYNTSLHSRGRRSEGPRMSRQPSEKEISAPQFDGATITPRGYENLRASSSSAFAKDFSWSS